MEDKVLTIILNGNITLDVFAEAIKNFKSSVEALANEISPNEHVLWEIENLEVGSVICGIRPVAEKTETPQKLSSAWAKIGHAAQEDRVIPYGETVQKNVKALLRPIESDINSIIFQTDDEDIPIMSKYKALEGVGRPPQKSLGTLKGRIDSLGRRKGIQFRLYDPIFDSPILCVLPAGKEDMVREYWGKRVSVSGKVSRDAETGKPFAIREISRIEPLSISEPGSWKKAIGALSVGGAREVLQGFDI